MVVALYQLAPGSWTFAEQPDSPPIRVRVPDGSEVLPMKMRGMPRLLLFVPGPQKGVRGPVTAAEIMAEVDRGNGRFGLLRRQREKIRAG